ncbi:TNFAIP3-interacting protein 2-like isoform X1 [Myxocyprinus asiaticus]|uniref:TNFAIP3-interacting protein 2-like isoform X1 n=1 Tax=Myxocyprinus asiaticus TaxID=70543 RepID=UPI00222304F2|nr:TNFAIP3-interacting protein 2-like isoform X1 [Myxocyprinus asiaticus]
MDEMKRENEALRAKLRSCSTLNTFYHETQQEITNLNQLVSTKDGIIADLRARLGKYEKTVVIEGEEPYIVGPSQSLIESLCKEICKLKQNLKDSEADAAQRQETSKTEIQRLQEKLKEKYQELEMIRQRPEQEKEREIQRLRSSLAERDRAQATRAVLCNSLAEEAEQLRAQLGATVQVCQKLLGRLEKEKSKAAMTDQRAQVHETTDSSEVSHLNVIISKLQEENDQLNKRVAYVESLNSKWQKYDSSREEYVRGLCQKLKESNGLASAGPTMTQTPTAGSAALIQQEIARLNGLLEEKMIESERLSRERDDNSRRDQERIQMLEQQVLAYIEDFKSERADRERAQGKILDLQNEVGRLQQQIRTQSIHEASSSRRLHMGLKKASHRQTNTAEPLRNSPPETSSKRTISNSAQQGDAELQCPRCLTTYDDEHAAEYLNHWDECAKL